MPFRLELHGRMALRQLKVLMKESPLPKMSSSVYRTRIIFFRRFAFGTCCPSDGTQLLRVLRCINFCKLVLQGAYIFV